MRILVIAVVLILSICGVTCAEFVTIGNINNPGDHKGFGSVGYEYKISEHEVTSAQFNAAVDADSRIGSANPAYKGKKPVGGVSWYEAAKYCNWLTSRDPYAGAYLFDDSGKFIKIDRDAAVAKYGKVYALPTDNEWYKAAYYTGSGYSLFANGTKRLPTGERDSNYGKQHFSMVWDVGSGAVEQNGTYDMMGNVWEWTEEMNRRGGACNSGIKGGHLQSDSVFPTDPMAEALPHGFRVVEVTAKTAGQ